MKMIRAATYSVLFFCFSIPLYATSTPTDTPTQTPTPSFTVTPAGTPTPTPTPVTPVIDSMTKAQFMNRFMDTVAGRDTGLFVRLTDPIIGRHFEDLIEAVLTRQLSDAMVEINWLSSIGVDYKLVELRNMPSTVLGFMEDNLPGDPNFKGWGAYLIRPDTPGYVIYQAPHVIADLYTEDINYQGFCENENGISIMFAGAHRYANGDDDGDGHPDSDAAHDSDSLFHVLSKYLADRGFGFGTAYWFNQIHGSADRDSEPTIVGADGSWIPWLTETSPLVLIDDHVDLAGYITMGVWGWWEGPGDDQDGVYELNGITNIQGNYLESLGLRCSFLHFEIENHARDDYFNGSGDGYLGILTLLDGIRTVMDTQHVQTPIPTQTPPSIPATRPLGIGIIILGITLSLSLNILGYRRRK